MNCQYCSYSSTIPESLFEHMVQIHGMVQENTPSYLYYLWKERGYGQGFYELRNPLTNKAPTHQKNSQRAQTIKLFNPNPTRSIEILPPPPEPWIKVHEHNYIFTFPLEDEIEKKIIIEGKIVPGLGILAITKSSVHEEKHFLREPTIESDTYNKILLEEHPKFLRDNIEYKKWELSFMNRSIAQINLIKGKIFGENILE